MIRLKKLLKDDIVTIIETLRPSPDAPLVIQDEAGKILFGSQDDSLPEHAPIMLEGHALGWVLGNSPVGTIANLLSHLAGREYEKKTLSQETLERYKEINLLYTISQKMASCLNPKDVALLVIAEARKIIKGSSAFVMLLNKATELLEVVAAAGTSYDSQMKFRVGEGIAGNVVLSGKGVILNDVRLSPDFIEGENQISSLICVPLQVEEKTFGVMNISSEEPMLYTAGDLKLTLALATQAAVSIENARLHAERLEQERMVKELEIARNIQQALLPETLPVMAGAEMAAMSQPAKEVGGDFYDIIQMNAQQVGAVIADVSGKGVPAALFMALSRALMRANSLHEPDVSQAVIQTNRLILDCTTAGLFVTLFYGILDAEQRVFRYVSAGHNPPILYKKAEGDITLLEADGIALGVIDEIELEEKSVQLAEGDVIVLYTDGVTEAINPRQEEFGEERLIQVVKDRHTLSAQELTTTIRDSVMTFIEEEPQFDDLTLMVIKIV